jgi:SEC-C motif
MDGVQGSDLCSDDADAVRQLLVIGDPRTYDPAKWPDYPFEFGIGREHISALIRLACDAALHNADTDSSTVSAPVHAWRALGQLRAEEAVEPLLFLLNMLEEDDAVVELPVVFGMIGPAAIPPIAGFLSDRSNPTSAVAMAISGIREIVMRHPECRGECIGTLARMLELHADTTRSTNGFVVSALIDLQAVEAIDTMRDAFRHNSVDIVIAGDQEDVEIDLGLRDRRATPALRYAILPADWSPRPSAGQIEHDICAWPRHEKTGRNEPCPCGRGKKYKKCCLP